MKRVVLMFLMIVLTGTSAEAVEFLSDLDVAALSKLGAAPEVKGPANPFSSRAMNAATLALEDLQLSGIVANDQEQYALISGYVIRPGDKIAGYRVESIEPGRVVLKRLDETSVLTLGGGL